MTTVSKGTFPPDWKEQLNRFYEQPQIRIVKQTKRSEQKVDIRPMIYKLSVKGEAIYMQNAAGSAENLKPGLVMEAFLHFLQLPAEEFRFSHHRLEMYANVGTEGQRGW